MDGRTFTPPTAALHLKTNHPIAAIPKPNPDFGFLQLDGLMLDFIQSTQKIESRAALEAADALMAQAQKLLSKPVERPRTGSLPQGMAEGIPTFEEWVGARFRSSIHSAFEPSENGTSFSASTSAESFELPTPTDESLSKRGSLSRVNSCPMMSPSSRLNLATTNPIIAPPEPQITTTPTTTRIRTPNLSLTSASTPPIAPVPSPQETQPVVPTPSKSSLEPVPMSVQILPLTEDLLRCLYGAMSAPAPLSVPVQPFVPLSDFAVKKKGSPKAKGTSPPPPPPTHCAVPLPPASLVVLPSNPMVTLEPVMPPIPNGLPEEQAAAWFHESSPLAINLQAMSQTIFEIMRNSSPQYNLGWVVLKTLWNVTPTDFDVIVRTALVQKPMRFTEQVLLTMAAFDLKRVQNLSAFACALIKEQENRPLLCMRFLAGIPPCSCQEPNAQEGSPTLPPQETKEDPQPNVVCCDGAHDGTAGEGPCSFLHPGESHGWQVLKQKWGITYKDIDYAALNYLYKQRPEAWDRILVDFSRCKLRKVGNLSAYLCRAIHSHAVKHGALSGAANTGNTKKQI